MGRIINGLMVLFHYADALVWWRRNGLATVVLVIYCLSAHRHSVQISTDYLSVADLILISTDCLSVEISYEARQTSSVQISTDCLSIKEPIFT